MAKCYKCGKTAKARLADARVCSDCWFQAGMKMSDPGYSSGLIQNPMKVDEFDAKLNDELARMRDAESVTPEKMISVGRFGYIGFNDDVERVIFKEHHPDVDYIYHYHVYSYGEIFDAEVVEKSSMRTIGSGGLGRAVVGGLLFGGVGAIVGAATANQTTTITASQDLIVYIKLNEDDIRQYRMPGNQEVLKKIESILAPRVKGKTATSSAVSEAEALLKFKELLDLGIITEDEFQQKKTQILGI